MAVRRFADGTDQIVVDNPTGAFTGAYSLAFTGKLTARDDGWHAFMGLYTSTGLFRIGMNRDNVNRMRLSTQSGFVDFGASGEFRVADLWWLAVITKGAGTVAPRLHFFKEGAGSMTHVDAAATIPNILASAATGEWRFGLFEGDTTNARYARSGVWDGTALSDANCEALLGANMASWAALSPLHLWEFNQATVVAIPDFRGAGGDEISHTGTTVETGDDPPSTIISTGLSAVGRSLVMPYTLRGRVGASLVTPYSVAGPSSPSFPTTVVLDDFNRADVGPPPSASWSTTGAFSAVGTQHSVISNRLGKTVTGFHSVYWLTSFAANQEVRVIVPVLPAGNEQVVFLLARLQTPGTAGVDGYGLNVSKAAGADTWDFYRIDNGAQTVLSSFTQEIAAGDGIGLKLVGTQLQAWFKSGAGAWTMVGTQTDATYNTTGYIGLETHDDIARFDDFGGGDSVTLETPINTVAPAVTGTPTQGATLTTTDGTWTGSPTPTFTYQWQRDVAGNGVWSNIGGATANTRVIQAADVPNRLRCVVTATNLAGVASANSNATAITGPLTTGPVQAMGPILLCGLVQVVYIAPSGTVAVGRSLVMPYTVRARIGRSLVTPYTVRSRAGRSLVTPYFVASLAAGRSLAMPYSLKARAGRSLVMIYAVGGPVGRSLVMPYSLLTEVSFLNGDLYSDGATASFGTVTPSGLALVVFATASEPWTAPANETDFYYARLPFHESRLVLEGGGAVAGLGARGRIGWHGTKLDDNDGSYAIVKTGGPLAHLLGERIRVTNRQGGHSFSVVAFVHNETGLLDEDVDISLTRALFARLGLLSEDHVVGLVETLL